MNLEEFLAIMHDKLIPRYVRCTVDDINVDMPKDWIADASKERFAGKVSGPRIGELRHEITT